MFKCIYNYTFIIILFCFGLGQIDYNLEIQPIFTTNCGNCHLGNSSGGLNLSNYDNTIAGNIIIPFDHASSELYDRITRPESDSGDMPPSGSLDQSDIDLIAQWIDEGAYEQPAGCTDPEAYNCADDDGVNYTFEGGGSSYVI